MKPLIRSSRNILMEMRKVCQHGYLGAPSIDEDDSKLPADEQHRRLTAGSGKLVFLKLLLPKLKERGHRVLLFSQFKMALNCIEDFLIGEGIKYLRLDGDIQQAERQKDMDKFNAPDSDYFIFLLTTRAGGVGINLATADTVIVFDPDFNPHQDLQAIARSHRYGQKKKVLVFRLMTKNSVEEKIIYAGKKKMVLDHLVVQSIDVEHEEGDIDSILLHGTAALYETEVDGVAPSDVVYNSKNVEEMIDRVEKEAEDMAVIMAEKDRLEAEAEERGEKVEASKDAKAFGFAKIWEANQNGLREVEEEEETEDINDGDLHQVIFNAQQDRMRREREEAEKSAIRYRSAKSGPADFTAAFSDGEGQDITPQKKKKGKQAKRKKGAETSDDDFAPQQDAGSETEGSDINDGELEAIIGEDGLPVILGNLPSGAPAPLGGLASADPLVPGKRRKVSKKARLLEEALAASNSTNGAAYTTAAEAASMMTNGQSAGPSTTTEHPPKNPAGKLAVMADKAANKALQRRKRLGYNAILQQRSHTLAARQAAAGRPMLTFPAPHPLAEQPATDIGQLTAEEAIRFGRYIVQWLYHLLCNFGYVKEINHWSRAAIKEIETTYRKALFDIAATKVDAQLLKTGGQTFFTVQLHNDAVYALIESGQDWIQHDATPMLAYPHAAHTDAGDQATSGAGSRSSGEYPAESSATAARRAANSVASAWNELGQRSAEGSSSLARGQPVMAASPPADGSFGGQAGGSAAMPTIPDGSAQEAEGARCELCHQQGHVFMECPTKPALSVLGDFKQNLKTMQLDPETRVEKATASGSLILETLRVKAIGFAELQRIIRLYRIAGQDVPAGLEDPLSPVPTSDAASLQRQQSDAAGRAAANDGGPSAPVPRNTQATGSTKRKGGRPEERGPPGNETSTETSAPSVDHILPADNEIVPDAHAAQGTAGTDAEPTGDPLSASQTERKPSTSDSPAKKRSRPAPLALRQSNRSTAGANGRQGSSQSQSLSQQRSRPSYGPGAGTKDDAIAIVDSDEDEAVAPAAIASHARSGSQNGLSTRPATGAAARAPSASAIQPNAEKSSNQAGPSPQGKGRGRPKLFKGCTICKDSTYHGASVCPVVKLGAQSIRNALAQFKDTDALYPILVELLQQAEQKERSQAARLQAEDGAGRNANGNGDDGGVCAFCNERCGRTIRQCAEAHGGRQALKKLIRTLQSTEAAEERSTLLFDAYQACLCF